MPVSLANPLSNVGVACTPIGASQVTFMGNTTISCGYSSTVASLRRPTTSSWGEPSRDDLWHARSTWRGRPCPVLSEKILIPPLSVKRTVSPTGSARLLLGRCWIGGMGWAWVDSGRARQTLMA